MFRAVLNASWNNEVGSGLSLSTSLHILALIVWGRFSHDMDHLASDSKNNESDIEGVLQGITVQLTHNNLG